MEAKAKQKLEQSLKVIENALVQLHKDYKKTSIGVKKAGRRMRINYLLISKHAKNARVIILADQKKKP